MNSRDQIRRERDTRATGSRRLWVYAGVVTVFAAAALWWILRARHPEPPTSLLATAYSERRTLELRFPGSVHTPLRTSRGPAERSHLSRPVALLQAEAIIARALPQHAEEAPWLQAKGRADLLDWNYTAAINTLNRARELSPESASLLIDLASAHFERAEAEARPIDYGQAIELLGRAVDKNPDDLVALFNRALVCERAHLYGQAVNDWQRAVGIDPGDGWGVEARRRLRALEQQLQRHRENQAQLDTSPGGYLRQIDIAGSGHCCADPELYLQQSLTDWLSTAFPVDADAVSRPAREVARKALQALAAALLERHRDPWMRDLLNSGSAPAFPQAARELSAAMRANAEGDPAGALECAKRASALFRSARSQAGALRADFEIVYALQRSAQGARCAQAGEKLATALRPYSWSWCKAQADLEVFSCRGMIGELGQALKAVDRALAVTQAAGYRVLRLRSLGGRAELDSSAGNFAASWVHDQAGLEEYWSGAYPAMRAYQFYDDMSLFAEEFAQWQLARVLSREAVSAMASIGNHSFEAIARNRLARMAFMAGAADEAGQEFARAEALFSGFPPSAAVQVYRMDGEIGMARLEIIRGETARASARLLPLRDTLPATANYPMAMEFYLALAEIGRRANPADQEKYLRSVVAVAEHGLESLNDDRERLRWLRQADHSYRELVLLAWSRRDFRRALELWEWYRGAALRLKRQTDEPANAGIDFAGLSDGPPLPQLDAVAEACPNLKHETVVSYAELAGGFAVWVYDDRGVSGHWIATPDRNLQRTAIRFAKRCADPGSDGEGLRADGRYLYEQLISPISAHLKPERTLLFELDGDLLRVPVQALVTPGGEYFGSTYGIGHSPGLSYLRRLRVMPDLKRARKALVVGSPSIAGDLAESFEPLPDATAEARSVASRFPNALLLTGREATLAAVTRALPDANVFHFAGHSGARTNDAGLLLASESPEGSEPAVLTPASLNSQIAKVCSLVVLSACSTEKLPNDALADPRSVPAALLGAGLPHVVASAWNVDSRATAAFMNAFYDALLSTGSVTDSLRAAETRISRLPATTHPYYWAAFNAWGQI
jgi:CHAT domain-containing protein/tetratricopeptide (TPR) repeat protein